MNRTRTEEGDNVCVEENQVLVLLVYIVAGATEQFAQGRPVRVPPELMVLAGEIKDPAERGVRGWRCI